MAFQRLLKEFPRIYAQSVNRIQNLRIYQVNTSLSGLSIMAFRFEDPNAILEAYNQAQYYHENTSSLSQKSTFLAFIRGADEDWILHQMTLFPSSTSAPRTGPACIRQVPLLTDRATGTLVKSDHRQKKPVKNKPHHMLERRKGGKENHQYYYHVYQ